MEKNIVVLDLKKYHKLDDFQKEIEKGKVVLHHYSRGYNTTSVYFSKDDFHKEIETKVEAEKKNTKAKDIEILGLKTQLSELKIKLEDTPKPKKLNLMQRIFDY